MGSRVSTRVLLGVLAAAMLGLGACADSDGLPPTRAVVGDDDVAIRVRDGDDAVHGVYGIAGVRRSFACRATAFRHFDFWVGEWTTTRPNGLPGGESSITQVLNGCAVDERYNGGTGRSLSRYDRSSGQWFQDYVDTTGFTLRLSGGLDSAGVMRMTDSVRAIRNGPSLASIFVWTPDSSGRVRQVWNFSLNGGATYRVNSNLLYARVPVPPALPAPVRSVCTDRPADRVMDALLGRWRVQDQHGRRLGETSVVLGAGGCLLEESFRGPLGYRMTSFLYRDSFVGRWYRTQADNVSNTFRTAGIVSSGVLQMTGVAPGPGSGTVPIRLTLDVSDPTHPRQQWELQQGDTWKVYAQVAWTRIE
jgi:hypothetical protein